MKEKNITTMRSVASGFSYVMDLVSDEVQDHHKKVAYLAYRLAEEMKLPPHACRLSLIGGLMHDIGGVLAEDKTSLWDLEANAGRLAKAGASIARLIPLDAPIAEIIQYSQPSGEKEPAESAEVFASAKEWLDRHAKMPEFIRKARFSWMIGQIIQLADAATLLFEGESSALGQAKKVTARLEELASCRHFHPWVMDAFRRLSVEESVWLDLLYEPDAFLEFIPDNEYLTLEKMSMFSEFASVIIDFRSPFTAMHSAGVSASAVELARLMGMSEDECVMMKIAGNLHDIGKLKVPKEILEKPGKLTDEEYDIIKEHPYFTWKILKHIEGMEQITEWAAFHHEKLNGQGYPFRLKGEHIHLGARIMAVADIFSAITEDRPYRKGMDRERALAVLRGDAEKGAISSGIVELLAENYEQVNKAREQASKAAGRRYRESLEKKNIG
ncbi:MAG: HD domain-containing protein [Lachnospiraceae bacterium]|nr:HD domain-containing protein [Lachnospiraceae bacterium]